MAARKSGSDYSGDDYMMEPIMCPFCGGGDLFEEEQTELETDEEYWVILHWRCADCNETFDKVIARALADAFEEDEEDDTLWS